MNHRGWQRFVPDRQSEIFDECLKNLLLSKVVLDKDRRVALW